MKITAQLAQGYTAEVQTDRLASRAVPWLSTLVAGLAVVASAVGLFSRGGSGPRVVTSIRGEAVELYGIGLYRFDTMFMAEGSRGTDIVTLALAAPLLLATVQLRRRGSRRGGLLLIGILAYFVYVYASRSLSNAYNAMFLVYVAAFSASVFGLALSIATVDRPTLSATLAVQPRRGLAAFLFASAAVTAAVWLLPLVGSAAGGQPPKLLDTYATSVTDVLDLGLIVPTLVVAGVLVLRRDALGHVLAVAMIVLLVLVGATIIAGTVLQVAAGVTFTPGEVIGPISGFLVLGAIGTVLMLRLLRSAGAGSTDPLAAPGGSSALSRRGWSAALSGNQDHSNGLRRNR
jgi:hypothetical protein